MKGFFSQGLVVLCSAPPSLEDLVRALPDLDLIPGEAAATIWMGGPGVRFDGPDGAQVIVDVVDQPWPDAMGSPDEDADLFGAWSMGFLGPFAFPGGLRRSTEQSYLWAGGPQAVVAHRAFVRLRVRYPGGPDDPVLPAEYQPLTELGWLTTTWRDLLELPTALCAFNPNGEVLAAAATFDRSLSFAKDGGIAPLDLWANVRMWAVDDTWMVMDTVGLGQLDEPDHEACFPRGIAEPNDVALLLRNTSWNVLSSGADVKDGDTIDGPGGMWRCRLSERGLVDPPRPTLRWFPVDGPRPPDALLATGG